MRRSEVAEDYYELLAVPADARLQDIKRAYRRRARELHPDAYGGKATEVRFHAVTVAYETLRDPELRCRYDDSRWHAREAERRLREERTERRRREEAQRREAERSRREEAERREAERRRREELERRRREEQAALAAARRRLDEERVRRQRSQARAPRILLACAVICCALGVGGTLLTLHKRDQALELHRGGLTAAATVRSFHEERV
ncbi:MAG: J domain-containing protein, partial [Pseudonocardiaceae bacterium]